MTRKERVAENIKRLRKQMGLTQEQLADAVKCNKSFVGRLESGVQSWGEETEKKFADFFKVDISEFLKPAEDEPQSFTIPVLAHISAGEGIYPVSQDTYPVGEGIERVEPPPQCRTYEQAIREGWYALKIKGDSMTPVLRDGDCISIRPGTPQEVRKGDIVVFRDIEGMGYVKSVLDISKGTFLFEGIGDGKMLARHISEIAVIERVMFIKMK